MFQHSATPNNLEGRCTRNKSEVLHSQSSNTASSVRWKISLFNDVSSHLLTKSNKSTHYYLQVTKVGFTLRLPCQRVFLYWLHRTTLKGIPHNLHRCGLTLPPPKLHKLPSNLTWDKYNYGMCAQVILTYVGGRGTVWVRYFNAIQHLML